MDDILREETPQNNTKTLTDETLSIENSEKTLEKFSGGKRLKESDYCDLINAYEKKINEKSGRIPGSRAEKETAKTIRDITLATVGEPASMEPFSVNQFLGKGMLPIIGIWYAICLIIYFVSPIACICLMAGFVPLALMYFGFFKNIKFLTRKTSYNVVSKLESKSKTATSTVVICGNYDSSFGHNYDSKRKFMTILQIVSICTIFVLLACAIVHACLKDVVDGVRIVFIVIPVVFCACPAVLTITYTAYSRSQVAENNATGVATALATYKYFVDHKELIPDGCRIIFVAFGSENAANSGSHAFLKQHPREEAFLTKPAMFNLGNVQNENFTVIHNSGVMQKPNNKAICSLVEDVVKKVNGNVLTYEKGLEGLYGFSSAQFSACNIPCTTLVGKDMNFKAKDLKDMDSASVITVRKTFRMSVIATKQIMEKISG